MMIFPSLICLFFLLKAILAELAVPELRSNHAKVYQSANQQSIDLFGSNFKTGISFIFKPALKVDEDYTLEIVDSNHAKLSLMKGKKWRSEAGLILAKSVSIDDNVFALGGDYGIAVAQVLTDPKVYHFLPATIYESQTHILKILSRSFTNITDIKVNLDPTSSSSFKLLWLSDTILALQLTGSAWLPPHLSLKGQSADKRVAFNVTSVDAGAGLVTFTTPFSLGFIIPDIKGVECNDSCEFSLDSVCDDGSEEMDDEYYGGSEPDYHRPPHQPKRNEDKTPACVLDTDCTDCGGVDGMLERDRSSL